MAKDKKQMLIIIYTPFLGNIYINNKYTSNINDVIIIKAFIFTPTIAKPILDNRSTKAHIKDVIFIFTLARVFKKETPIALGSVLANDKKLHTHNKILYSPSWQREYIRYVNKHDNNIEIVINT